MIKIICEILHPEKSFIISLYQLKCCGYLSSLYSFNSLNNLNPNELIVDCDVYNMLYDIYNNGEEFHNDDYDYLQYTHYENIFCESRNLIMEIENLEKSNDLSLENELYFHDVIPAKNIETNNTIWTYTQKEFNCLINCIIKIVKENFKNEFVIAGDAALRKYYDYPEQWNEISNISIYIVNNNNEASQLIHYIAACFPGKEVKYNENSFEYGIIKIHTNLYNSYNKILLNYDVDCLSILYSITKNKYFCTYQCKYALKHKFNTLWIFDKPKDGYENRNLQALHFGFGLRIPNYNKFIKLFVPDINVFSKKFLSCSEYIYYYLLTNNIFPTCQYYSFVDSWSYLQWYSSFVAFPKPSILGKRDQCFNLCSEKRKMSYKDAILKEKNNLKLDSLEESIIKAPFVEFCPIQTYENGYCSSPKSDKIKKNISFSYCIKDFFKKISNIFPIIITGGIISEILNIESNFPYTIHLLKNKLYDRCVNKLLKDIHQFILEHFNISLFEEKDEFIYYFCKYKLYLHKIPKTLKKSLESEIIDFCRVGYTKLGFITDETGQLALSKRIHFTSEDVNLPADIFDIGFRTIVSKNFIIEKIIQRDFLNF